MLGELPESEADQLLKLMPATQPVKPRLITDNKQNAENPAGNIDGEDFERALQVSRQMADSEDTALQKALSMSMQGAFINIFMYQDRDFQIPSGFE